MIVLVETWLNDKIDSAHLFDKSRWAVFRRDRYGNCVDDLTSDDHVNVNNRDGNSAIGENVEDCFNDQDANKSKKRREGGGVLIAVEKNLCPTDDDVFLIPKDNKSEQVWVKIRLPAKNIFVGVAYTPPKSDDLVYDSVSATVVSVMSNMLPHDDIFLYGDFNLPNTIWISDMDNPLVYRPSGAITPFLEKMSDLGLAQISDVKVHNQLDLVFTNVVCDFVIGPSPHSLKEDCRHHRSVSLDYEVLKPDFSIEEGEFFDFRRIDTYKASEALRNIDWESEFENLDLEEKVDRFYRMMRKVVEDCVPRRRRRYKYRLPWMSPQLAKLRNKRNRTFKKFRQSGQAVDFQSFLNHREQFLELNSVLYQQYENSQADLIQQDPKQFWRLVNKRRGIDGVPENVVLDEKQASNHQDATNLFADYFQSVFAPDSSGVSLPSGPSPALLSKLVISEESILVGLKKLNVNKGAGPDQLPNSFLRSLSVELSHPMFLLFNESLSSGVFPYVWKESYMTPIFKSGRRSNVRNYRGVVALSAVPKFFEKLVCDLIEPLIAPSINPNQHGFSKSRSTCTNLTIYVHNVLERMRGAGQVDAIYTDFAKAFDRVNHRLLLRKLELLGIDGVLLSWLRSYLNGRQHRVRIGSKMSRPFAAVSGVPQGSHLGPLMFSLFINDLCDELTESNFLLFADDLKFYRKIESVDDAVKLQKDLEAVNRWCSDNMMELNINKCEVISFKNTRSELVTYDYQLNDISLRRVDRIKDLGVMLDNRMNFRSHIDHVAAKARSALYFVKLIAKDYSCPYVTKRLYQALVRPIVEYCSVAWCPYKSGDIGVIEGIQKQFLEFALCGIRWSHRYIRPKYEARLGLLNLDSLEDRRKLAKLVLCHNQIKGRLSLNEFIVIPPPRNLRSSMYPKLKAFEVSGVNYIDNGPIRSCIDTFNRYAPYFKSGLVAFKSSVRDQFLAERRLRLQILGYIQ